MPHLRTESCSEVRPAVQFVPKMASIIFVTTLPKSRNQEIIFPIKLATAPPNESNPPFVTFRTHSMIPRKGVTKIDHTA